MRNHTANKVIKYSKFRYFSATAILFVIVLGLSGNLGWGTLCSLNLGGTRLSCPLGYLQLSLANHAFEPSAWLSVGLVVVIILLAGRFFCAWICPAKLLQVIFKPRRKTGNQLDFSRRAEQAMTARLAEARQNPGLNQSESPLVSYAVLGGSLLSSWIFGFPVFCAICPLGLLFGLLFAIRRLFFNQVPSLELVLFPLLLITEIFVLRKWCARLCPLGALMSLLGSFNRRFLHPTIDRQKCFLSQGINCQACRKVCPEKLDLPVMKNPSLQGCTSCLECFDRCPERAIKLTGLTTSK